MGRMRRWQGPALFSYGFRPFFLFGALEAAVSIAVFVPWYLGAVEPPSALPPLAWHTHAMLFGYVPAVVAGFLLTAVPNWTGRMPVVGWPLVVLFGLWCVGRAAMLLSLQLGPWLAALLDLAFLAALTGIVAREVVAGRNWRNLKVLVAIVVLFLADVLFHWEFWRFGRALIAERLAIAAAIGLIMLIGGRIVPSFTTNWLRRHDPRQPPLTFGNVDKAAMAVGIAALFAWVAVPLLPALAPLAAALLAIAAALHAWRLSRWATLKTLSEPLVLILHVAYAFVPLGYALGALGAASGLASHVTAGVHAWTSGAIALMTLAVMTRATRGHTGRPLTARNATAALYLCALLAAALRVLVALAPEASAWGLPVATLFWVAAFFGFVLLYGPMLAKPPVSG